MGSYSGPAMVNCQPTLLLVITWAFLVCLDGGGKVSRITGTEREMAITKEVEKTKKKGRHVKVFGTRKEKSTEDSSNKKKGKSRKRKKEQIKTIAAKGKKYQKNKRVKTLLKSIEKKGRKR